MRSFRILASSLSACASAVAALGADQHQQPGAYAAYGLAGNHHARFGHALQQRLHQSVTPAATNSGLPTGPDRKLTNSWASACCLPDASGAAV
jgi:hypothetical protein